MYYYVYRITCDHPESVEKYYYGFRSCQCPPQEDTVYWSSSRYVQHARKTFGEGWFRKKILRVFDVREEALALEIRLHAFFDVKNHPFFFNRANQTSTKFHTGGQRLSEESRQKMSQAKQGKSFVTHAVEFLIQWKVEQKSVHQIEGKNALQCLNKQGTNYPKVYKEIRTLDSVLFPRLPERRLVKPIVESRSPKQHVRKCEQGKRKNNKTHHQRCVLSKRPFFDQKSLSELERSTCVSRNDALIDALRATRFALVVQC